LWADKRTTTATATLARDREGMGSDWAFITQPGRIPERTRMNARADRSYASLQKADQMRARAAGIEKAAGRAIYSDDANAIGALRTRIAGLEAERGRIVAYNKAVRKAGKVTPEALALLDDKQREDLKVLARVGQLRADGAFPAYATSNLSGNISRNRDRLAELEAAAAARPARSLRGT
jgi:hypothetical protein